MQLFSYAVVRTTPKDTDSLKLLKSMQEGGLWNVSIYPLTTTLLQRLRIIFIFSMFVSRLPFYLIVFRLTQIQS